MAMGWPRVWSFGRGTNGVSTNGVTANVSLFARGTFWVLPLTYLSHPESARAYISPRSVKSHYLFATGPVIVDPICPQPNFGHENSPLIINIMLESNPLKSINVSTEIGRSVGPICPQPKVLAHGDHRALRCHRDAASALAWFRRGIWKQNSLLFDLQVT